LGCSGLMDLHRRLLCGRVGGWGLRHGEESDRAGGLRTGSRRVCGAGASKKLSAVQLRLMLNSCMVAGLRAVRWERTRARRVVRGLRNFAGVGRAVDTQDGAPEPTWSHSRRGPCFSSADASGRAGATRGYHWYGRCGCQNCTRVCRVGESADVRGACRSLGPGLLQGIPRSGLCHAEERSYGSLQGEALVKMGVGGGWGGVGGGGGQRGAWGLGRGGGWREPPGKGVCGWCSE